MTEDEFIELINKLREMSNQPPLAGESRDKYLTAVKKELENDE